MLLAAGSRSLSRSIRRSITTAKKATVQSIPSCPSPTCPCSPMPSLPAGLEIDHSTPLNGTMPTYATQLLVCTGQTDWTSKIEDENAGDNVAADVKELLGRGGVYCDPYHNVSVLNSSFPPTPTPASLYPPTLLSSSAYILPSFKYVPYLPRVSFDSVQALVRGFLLPTSLHPIHDSLSPIHRDRLTRTASEASKLSGVTDVTDVLVLICGHGGRDQRCGVLGPVLRDEFGRVLQFKGIRVVEGPVEGERRDTGCQGIGDGGNGMLRNVHARVGLISHVGGHKFAGNTIIYVPPTAKGEDGKRHALAGCGVWYGRVRPEMVEGIIEETIVKGRIIEDLFRGGIRRSGEILRLPT